MNGNITIYYIYTKIYLKIITYFNSFFSTSIGSCVSVSMANLTSVDAKVKALYEEKENK